MKKISYIVFGIILSLPLLWQVSCATTAPKPAEKSVPRTPQTSLEASGIPYFKAAPADGVLRSAYDRETAPSITLDKNVFHDYIIFKREAEYTLYGETQTVVYYIVWFDFVKTIGDDTPVAEGMEIGRINKRDFKITVFCDTPDPYMVVNDDTPPVYYDGRYWFQGAFIMPSGSTDWLSFDPVDDFFDKLTAMAEHHSKPPGFNFYPDFRVRFKTSLPDYPRKLTFEERDRIAHYERILYNRYGLMTYANKLDVNGYTFLLCWQNGFLDYLTREYVLGGDIWLYGNVVTYDAFDNTGYIFLRDFSLKPVEEMYEDRINKRGKEK